MKVLLFLSVALNLYFICRWWTVNIPNYILTHDIVVNAYAKIAIHRMVEFAKNKGFNILTTEVKISETYDEPVYTLTVYVEGGCDYELWMQYVDEFLVYEEHNRNSVSYLFNNRCIYQFK